MTEHPRRQVGQSADRGSRQGTWGRPPSPAPCPRRERRAASYGTKARRSRSQQRPGRHKGTASAGSPCARPQRKLELREAPLCPAGDHVPDEPAAGGSRDGQFPKHLLIMYVPLKRRGLGVCLWLPQCRERELPGGRNSGASGVMTPPACSWGSSTKASGRSQSLPALGLGTRAFFC